MAAVADRSGDPIATAVVVAAGSGERLGAGGPKSLVEVGGRPMFEWSLVACEDSIRIGPVVLVVPPDDRQAFLDAGVGKAVVVDGGEYRSDSVANGLAAVETAIVAIHDAARPMVTPEAFDAAVSALVGDDGLDGLILAGPVDDTVKRVDESGLVVETLDRARLRAVATPQVFRVEPLRRALASGDRAIATDDASLVEAAGGRVAVLELPDPNPKVTRPGDLDVVEALLERGRGRVPDWKVRGC